MLEYFYRERRTMVDFRRGPLGPHFDGFAGFLKNAGYSHSRARVILGRSCRFNYYLMERSITDPRTVTPELVEQFIKAYLRGFRTAYAYGADQPNRVRSDMQRLIGYLVQAKIIEVTASKRPAKPFDWMLDPYLDYLRREGGRQCGLSDATITRKTQMLMPFLEALGSTVKPDKMKSLQAEAIEVHLKNHLRDSRDNFQCLISALRGFLRFCAREGYTAQDLSGMLPHAPHYRMASLPKGMEDAALERMLATIDRNTPRGLRDYALMLVLMAYGVRGKQAVELALDDINWPSSLIRIRPQKGGKEVVLPLLPAVGEAILAYLRHRPQQSPFRQVFLTGRAPFCPLTGIQVGAIVRRYALKAGLKVPRCGAHTLRHSWAIRALAHDVPIKAIADVLGHRHLDTTFIYAKADLPALRQVAMPWPEVMQ
jgi:integrase/recombinase XerD